MNERVEYGHGDERDRGGPVHEWYPEDSFSDAIGKDTLEQFPELSAVRDDRLALGLGQSAKLAIRQLGQLSELSVKLRHFSYYAI